MKSSLLVFSRRSFAFVLMLFCLAAPAFGADSPSLIDRIALGDESVAIFNSELLFSDPTVLVVDLPQGQTIVCKNQKTFRRGSGDLTWIGTFPAGAFGMAAFAVDRHGASGLIFADQQVFTVRVDSDRLASINLFDAAQVPDFAEPITPPTSTPARSKTTADPKDDGSIIDVMIVYSARAHHGGGDMGRESQLVVDLANWSYEQSGINQRLRLVHATSSTYVEDSSSVITLSELADPTDGELDEVHALRDLYGADLVGLWVLSFDACGRAYIMTNVAPDFETAAFSVATRFCSYVWGWAHEIGHNMGARHDWFVDSNITPYEYAHGYTFELNDFLCIRSIMAYPDFCRSVGKLMIPIPLFSNPNKTVLGNAFGVPQGDPQPADVASTFNNTAFTVANFRQSACDCAMGGGCYEQGQVDPDNPCQICDSADSAMSWSSNDQASCDDELFCNGEESCQGGQCVSSGDPCNDNQTCDEQLDICRNQGQDDDDDMADDDDSGDDDDNNDDVQVDDDDNDDSPNEKNELEDSSDSGSDCGC